MRFYCEKIIEDYNYRIVIGLSLPSYRKYSLFSHELFMGMNDFMAMRHCLYAYIV